MPIPRNVHETLLNRIPFVLPVILSMMVAVIVSACGRSSSDDSADAAHEKRENIRAILAKAKEAEEDGNINFCGFYVGMAKADADALVSHYGLKPGESALYGDPIYDIRLTLHGVRRITKGGNSYDELCQAVANRIGNLKHKHDDGDWYEYKTIDGVRLTMSEERLTGIIAGFRLWDDTGKIKAEATRNQMVDGFVDSMVSIPGKDYRMGKTEVTQAQWKFVMGTNPSNFSGADNPVENVSWNDCQEFLEKLNALPEVKASGLVFRLPTEEEWKYACRAGATADYCKLADGTEIMADTLGKVAWFEGNSDCKTHPVGQKEPNAFGLYDMHGNVWEWTQTAICGGSWAVSDWCCGSSYRDGDSPDSRFDGLGFRLCASGRAD